MKIRSSGQTLSQMSRSSFTICTPSGTQTLGQWRRLAERAPVCGKDVVQRGTMQREGGQGHARTVEQPVIWGSAVCRHRRKAEITSSSVSSRMKSCP